MQAQTPARHAGHPLTVHIRTTAQCRELCAAIAALAPHDAGIPRYLSLLAGRGAAADCTPSADCTPISDAEAQVTLLVLRDVDRPTSALPAGSTAAGRRLLGQVQGRVFPGQERECQGAAASLMQLTYCSSYAQARAVRALCEAVACEAVCRSDTCLLLLPLAHECSCKQLLACSLREAGRAFLQLRGTTAFLALPLEPLLQLLGSCHLVVDSEIEVWEAVAAWVLHEEADRSRHLLRLIVEGVRLVHMSRDSLSLVDIHPLVRGSIEASMLVAEVFMAASGYPLPIFPLCRQLFARAAAAQPRGSCAGPPYTPPECPRTAELRGGGSGGTEPPPLSWPELSFGSISFAAPGVSSPEAFSTARNFGVAVVDGSPSQGVLRAHREGVAATLSFVDNHTASVAAPSLPFSFVSPCMAGFNRPPPCSSLSMAASPAERQGPSLARALFHDGAKMWTPEGEAVFSATHCSGGSSRSHFHRRMSSVLRCPTSQAAEGGPTLSSDWILNAVDVELRLLSTALPFSNTRARGSRKRLRFD